MWKKHFIFRIETKIDDLEIIIQNLGLESHFCPQVPYSSGRTAHYTSHQTLHCQDIFHNTSCHNQGSDHSILLLITDYSYHSADSFLISLSEYIRIRFLNFIFSKKIGDITSKVMQPPNLLVD